MKRLLKCWLTGWAIIGRALWFFLIVAVICMPVNVAQEGFNRHGDTIWSDGVFHWKRAMVLLIALVLYPFAMYIANKLTGFFNYTDTKPNNRIQELSPAADAPDEA